MDIKLVQTLLEIYFTISIIFTIAILVSRAGYIINHFSISLERGWLDVVHETCIFLVQVLLCLVGFPIIALFIAYKEI